MSAIYLKTSTRRPETDSADVRQAVENMLAKIARNGEVAARAYSRDLDRWDGEIVVPAEARGAAAAALPEQLKADIRFAHDNIRRFAEAQRATIGECSIEVLPGLTAGQRQIPVSTAGCYVPGGRYSHVASAIMTITTAKVAVVGHITAS